MNYLGLRIEYLKCTNFRAGFIFAHSFLAHLIFAQTFYIFSRRKTLENPTKQEIFYRFIAIFMKI